MAKDVKAAKGVASKCLRCKSDMSVKGEKNEAVCPNCGWKR